MSEWQTLRLDAEDVTLVFAWSDGIPEILHFGARLTDDVDLEELAESRVRPLAFGTLDQSAPVNIHPEISRGFMGHPAMIANRPDADIAGWAGLFTFSSYERVEDGVRFAFNDAHRGLLLEMRCQLCQTTGVATFKTRVTNESDSDIVIDWLSAPVVPVPQDMSEYLSFHGRWCAEFSIDRRTVPVGLVKSENRRGRTSHEAFPGVVLLQPTADETTGSCLGIHLGWSGNHRMILERLSTGDTQVQMGILQFSGEGEIPPGASLETPEMYVATSDHGLNALSQRFHGYIRKHILKLPDPNKPRPVTVNTWEALYFDHSFEKLSALADAAASVGAERYVLDDGWFHKRNDDTTSLGDWFPDADKYPDGLGPIADYVVSKSMEFGLWVEPEMVNPDSDLYRKHPDWVLGLNPYPLVFGRNQLVLDLTDKNVADYLFNRIAKLLDDHPISYLKWDMNRDLVLPGDSSGKAAVHRQTQGLYKLIDRIRSAYPNVEIESCASGGGRIDFEILKRTHRFWTSDSNDAVERMRIQTGFSYFFPPEVMGAHVGPAWCHTSGRGFHPNFRALVASYGHMGVEMDLRKASSEELDIISHAIERYKQDRKLWHTGNFYRMRTVDPNLLGAATVSEDRKTARLIMTQIDRPRSVVPPLIRIPGLDPSRHYSVKLQSKIEHVKTGNRKFNNPLIAAGIDIPGSVLSYSGIQVPILYAQTGIALSIDAIDEVAKS